MTEERILDFLDGNLGAHEEEELLHRLAVSPERRALLRQHLNMRDLTASLARRQYVPVPKAVTATLFTALAANGYSGPAMPAPTESREALIAGNVPKMAGVFRRSAIVASLMIAFIAGGAMMYFLTPSASQEKLAAKAEPVMQSNFVERAAETNSPDRSNKTYKSNMSSRSNMSHKTYPTYSTNNDLSLNEVSSSVTTLSILKIEAKNPPLALADIRGGESREANPFNHLIPSQPESRTFLQRLNFSLRSGEGKAPGNSSALSGSLSEIKISYDITDWLAAKLSLGQFMSYETEAIPAKQRFNADGIPLLQLSPVSKTRAIMGAEVGAKFSIYGAPFEADAGFISDMQSAFIPRAGFFTKLEINNNFNLKIGLEGMIYNHDILPSLLRAEESYPGQHPSLIGGMQSKETTGFIGPALEMVWHW